ERDRLAGCYRGRVGDGEALRPAPPDGPVICAHPYSVGTGADLIRKLSQLRRRYDVVLVCSERRSIQNEMSAPASGVPEVILGRRAAERIAVAEQRGRGEVLVGKRLDLRICGRHRGPAVDWRGDGEAVRPVAPLHPIVGPYPEGVGARAC